jgi:hypothetical protein
METKKLTPADIEPVTSYKRSISVHQYSLDGKYIKTFKSMHAASDATKSPYSSIAECVKGKFKTAGGFQWRKAE